MSMLHVHVPVHVHHRSACVCECVFLCEFVCINAGLPDCPASDQSGTGMKKLTIPGMVRFWTKPRQSGFFDPVPDWNYWCGNADAGVSFLDADAQQCYFPHLFSFFGAPGSTALISLCCRTLWQYKFISLWFVLQILKNRPFNHLLSPFLVYLKKFSETRNNCTALAAPSRRDCQFAF
jgi:hypothetical protein